MGNAGRLAGGETCIDPGVTTPEDIIAYVDGEAARAVAGHIRRCPHCTAQARELARAESTLRRVLYRFDCPQPHALGEYELDLLGPGERTAVAAHVLDCPRCAEELKTLRDFLRAEPAMPQAEVLVPAWQSPAAGRAGWLERVVATLVAPAPQLAAVRLRGTRDDGTKTYQTSDATVTITIDPGPETRPGRVSILGLVVREGPMGGVDTLPGPTGNEVRLVAPDGTTQMGALDDLGNFTFDDLAPATYQLEVQLPDRIVVVEAMSVGEP
jgi:hypothetical protein